MIQTIEKELSEEFKIHVEIIDKNRNCRRKLPLNSMLFTGDKISKATSENSFRIYMVEISQKIQLSSKSGCIENFNFCDCDEKFMRDFIGKYEMLFTLITPKLI